MSTDLISTLSALTAIQQVAAAKRYASLLKIICEGSGDFFTAGLQQEILDALSWLGQRGVMPAQAALTAYDGRVFP